MVKITKVLKIVPFCVPFYEEGQMRKKKYHIGFYPSKKVARWGELSREQQQAVMKKEWYIRGSYRNPETWKMERQDNIKLGINQHKTKRDRLQAVKTYMESLSCLLRSGYSPYDDDPFDLDEVMSVEKAFDFGLDMKKKTISENSFIRFKSRINRFKD